MTIDRAAWLRERRAAVEADYDEDAPAYARPTAEEYDDHHGWGYRHLLLRSD